MRISQVRHLHGFTLIELLIVIGILGILAGILLVGLNALGTESAQRQTRGMMASAEAMLSELQRQVGRQQSPPLVYFEGTILAALPAPGSVTRGASDRTTSTAVLNTANLMAKIRRTPAGNELFNNIPAEKLLRIDSGGESATLLLDGWDNPIIYVPPTGLRDVRLRTRNAAGQEVIETRTILHPEGRGFWASAGPDENFLEGNDNLYSFE